MNQPDPPAPSSPGDPAFAAAGADGAVPAATLVVMREGARPGLAPELLMVRREAGLAFAAGAWVFPGGRVDDDDAALGGDGPLGARTAAVAAIRETLEEVALPIGLVPAVPPALAGDLQRALLGGEAFSALLARHALTLDLDALAPFARWAPQMKLKRRFDTLFLLARAPEGAYPVRLQPGECAEACWTSAAAMLARIAAGDASAIFPTKRNLERLARHDGFAAAREDARRHGTARIVPQVEQVDGVAFVCIPEGIGYPVTREPLSSALRA